MLTRWLYPGLGLKRWAILSGVGVGIIVVGLWNIVNSRLAKDFTYAVFRWLNAHLPHLSFYQGLICALVGLIFILWCFAMTVSRYMKMTYGKTGLDDYYKNVSRSQGPHIVAIGGGTGLSTLLKGLKVYTSNITAAVTVGDDGGSSGKLRKEFGVVPVGDIRNCIVALADEERVMETLFSYRFSSGSALKGHTLGNLLLLAMTNITGNFQDAISGIDDVLHISGKVLPITNVPLILEANFNSGRTVRGESYLSKVNEPIVKLNVLPEKATILPEVMESISEADVIILGPGSLYTSVIPNLCVKGVVDAIKESGARVIYVCNVVTQVGETLGYTAGDHLKAIIDHSVIDLIDYIVVDDGDLSKNIQLSDQIKQGSEPVYVDEEYIENLGVKILRGTLSSSENPYRHDSDILAQVIIDGLYHDKYFYKRRGIAKSFWDYQKFKSYFIKERE